MNPHIPTVRIVTPAADELGMVLTVLTRMTIDGEEWAVTEFAVKGSVDGLVTLSLTILADVTIEHPPGDGR
jgi:hypothetical protein